jgi:hypothetical protein
MVQRHPPKGGRERDTDFDRTQFALTMVMRVDEGGSHRNAPLVTDDNAKASAVSSCSSTSEGADSQVFVALMLHW